MVATGVKLWLGIGFVNEFWPSNVFCLERESKVMVICSKMIIGVGGWKLN